MDQQTLFDPTKVSLRQRPPVAGLADSARAYTGGSWDGEDLANTTVSGPAGFAMKRTYEQGIGSKPSPAIMGSYEALREHISSQFDQLTSPKDQGGAGISVEVTQDDPYPSFEDMHADVTQNSRLRVMSTATTGSHAFFSDEENDKFRAVHDAYGHLATGRGFDRHGEEAAYRSHARMLPQEAHAALASETRGQNSYLNWGGGDFPPNAPVDMPNWMTKEEVAPPQKRIRAAKTEQMRLF